MRINDNGIDRDMTEAELATYNAFVQDVQASADAKAKAESDKTAAKQAILNKLGLTANEVTALLG